MESSDQNKSRPLSTSSIINTEQKRIREDIPQTPSSLSPSQVSHISNLFPSANGYEDEQHIAHPIDQRLAISSSGTSGKATTITEPTIAQDVPLIDETGVTISQFRRSETPHPFEYKASADLKEQSDAILRTTIMAISGHNEETQETPINVNHVCHQQSRGIKQTTTSISQISFTTDYAELDESAIQLDQLQRLESPQPVTYKVPADIQPSTGTSLKTLSAFGQEEPAQETPVNITQLRQSTIKDLSALDTTKQQASSIMQPSATTDVPILNETAVHLNQVHRPDQRPSQGTFFCPDRNA